MTNKQVELLKFCGFEVDDSHLLVRDKNKDSLVTICYNSVAKLFTIKTTGFHFKAKDYDSVEKFSIDLNRKLSLVYELNTYMGDDNVRS